MPTIIQDILDTLKDWQKALVFSFVSYMVLLFLIVLTAFVVLKNIPGFLTILAGITIVYIFIMLSLVQIARTLFKNRLTEV